MEVINQINIIPGIIACIFLIADVVFGIAQAFANQCFESSKMRHGLWHKFGELGAIVLAYIIEVSGYFVDFGAIGFPEDLTIPSVMVVSMYIVFMEIGSIIENLCKITPELKTMPFIKYFVKSQEQNDDKKESVTDGDK